MLRNLLASVRVAVRDFKRRMYRRARRAALPDPLK